MSEPQTGLDVLRASMEGRGMPAPPCSVVTGAEFLEIESGRSRMRFAASEQFYNPRGTVQGGFLAAMLDDVMGTAAFTTLPVGNVAPTLEMKVSFHRPAYAGTILGEGRLVHRTRSVAWMEGRLETEDGELLATASATARIISGDVPMSPK